MQATILAAEKRCQPVVWAVLALPGNRLNLKTSPARSDWKAGACEYRFLRRYLQSNPHSLSVSGRSPLIRDVILFVSWNQKGKPAQFEDGHPSKPSISEVGSELSAPHGV